MLEIIIPAVVVVVVLAVPALRRAVLSFLGLIAVIMAGAAVVAVVVWALYEAKPWITPDAPEVAEDTGKPDRGVAPNPAVVRTCQRSCGSMDNAIFADPTLDDF